MNIVAAPLGALLMSLLAFYQVISIDIVTAIIAITPLLFIRIPQPVRKLDEATAQCQVDVERHGEGFRFMRAWPGMLMITVVAAFINFVLAPTGTFLPLMVTQHFHLGVWELSLLRISNGNRQL